MDVCEYISFFEDFPEAVVAFDADRRIVSANSAFENLSGYLRSEITGQGFFALFEIAETVLPADWQGSDADNQPGLLSANSVAFKHKNGAVFFVKLRCRAIRDGDGENVATYCIVQDVSARTRFLQLFDQTVDRAVTGTESLTEWFADLLDAGCSGVDLDIGVIYRYQDGLAEIQQSTAEQGRYAKGGKIPLNKAICENLASEWLPYMAGVFSSDDAGRRSFDHAGELKSYITVPICMNNVLHGMLAFFDARALSRTFDALEVAAVTTLARRIAGGLHHQKRAEEQARTARQLVESEARYKALFRSVPAMMVYRSQEGGIVDATEQFIERFGYNRAELIGKRPVDIMTPDSRTRVEGQSRRLSRKDAKIRNEPYEMVTKRGEIVDIEVSAKRQKDGTELGAVIDVSERNRARLQLEKRNRELERLNESLKHFTSIASHDMQEPLRKIRYFSDMLGQAVNSGNQADIDYALAVLTDAARRASVLVSDLLDFSRASNKALENETIDLRELIEGVIAEVLREEKVPASTFIFDIPQLIVSGDRTAIVQMCRNLIGNALKYRHPERAPRVVISAELGNDGDAPAVIRIQDNGIGFEPEYAEMILKPFTRLHRRAQYPGSGVGLAICDVVAQRHGWALRAEGQPDDGAAFEISIPTYFVDVD